MTDGPNDTNGARRSNIEFVIPTFNEEKNLPHSIGSCIDWADAVHVVDSESTDGTREIAEKAGANYVLRPWLGYAKQKNWALDNLPLKGGLGLHLDADESITPELRDELMAIASKPVDQVASAGYYVNRLTYFMNRPIRRCGFYPAYNLRFFKRGTARYEEREVHEHMLVEGETERLEHIMLHNDRRGLEHFIAKHNRYSTLEARELVRREMGQDEASAAVLERGIAFRRWLKYNVLPRLPLPAFWRFSYMYFVRLGFLDGINGFRFSLFLASYDFFISLKRIEIKREIEEGADPFAQDHGRTSGLSKAEGSVHSTDRATETADA